MIESYSLNETPTVEAELSVGVGEGLGNSWLTFPGMELPSQVDARVFRYSQDAAPKVEPSFHD